MTECCILQNIRSSPECVEWEAARALARSGEEVELTGEEPRPVELRTGMLVLYIEVVTMVTW